MNVIIGSIDIPPTNTAGSPSKPSGSSDDSCLILFLISFNWSYASTPFENSIWTTPIELYALLVIDEKFGSVTKSSSRISITSRSTVSADAPGYIAITKACGTFMLATNSTLSPVTE